MSWRIICWHCSTRMITKFQKLKHLFYILLFITFSGSIYGQKAISISGRYENKPFVEVVNYLEKKYPIRFYYDQQWIDSLSVSFDHKSAELKQVLSSMLKDTDLHVFVDRYNNVILTYDYQVINNIPDRFFSDNKTIDVTLEEVENTASDKMVTGILTKDFKQSSDDGEVIKPIRFGNVNNQSSGGTVTIDGYLRNEINGEPLIGASVFIKELTIGVITDPFGYYSFTLPKGNHTIRFQYIGMKDASRQVQAYADGRLDLNMKADLVSLKEVVVKAERDKVDDIQTGLTRLTPKQLKIVPTVLGEADIMKITLTLPGVQTVGEGATGFNVRGGEVDQNLITLDDATIYNPNHLFGFFSAFNSDVIGSADLYKSGFQAEYGGRVSSVFDVNIRDGNRNKFSAKGGISPVTTKVSVEGPIKKEQSSFIFGLRSTYSDWILSLINDPSIRNSSGSFFDVVSKVSHKVNEKNDITLSGYHSKDKFRLSSDTSYNYVNTSATLKWRHSFNKKLYGVTSLSYSDYEFKVANEVNPLESFELGYRLSDGQLKYDMSYFPNAKHRVKFGLSSKLYKLNPGFSRPLGNESIFSPEQLQKETALESAIHIGTESEITSKLSVYGGVRATLYNFLGAADVITYGEGVPKAEAFIVDTVSYDKGEIVQTYGGPEFRFSMRYKINPTFSFKASYDNTRQYIHILTNSIAVSPTDTWKLSDTHIKPKIGNQYSAGFYKSFSSSDITLSVEGYYKEVKNFIQYKSGAELLLNEALETDVINGFSKSYGIEFMLKRTSGRLNGWLSYTYSRAFAQANGPFKSEKINNGEFYPANFDKPHSLALVSNYKINRRVNFSVNYTFSTGRPTSFPFTIYNFGGRAYPFFSERNQFRIPDYHRVDIGANFEGNHKQHKRIHGTWSFSIYNLLSRDNVYSVFFRNGVNNSNNFDNGVQAFQLSVFSNMIPTLTYNFTIR